jgi:hypothetical protein
VQKKGAIGRNVGGEALGEIRGGRVEDEDKYGKYKELELEQK